MGLGAADAVDDEGGVVAVPAVLPQQRRRVPEPGHRFLGHVERPEPGVQRPALGRRADRCSGGEVGNTHQTGGVGELPDLLPQRGGAAPLAHGDRLLGSGLPPHPRDMARHLAVGEVVEDRVHHPGRCQPQRRGPAREVPSVVHIAPGSISSGLGMFMVRQVSDRCRGLPDPRGSGYRAGGTGAGR